MQSFILRDDTLESGFFSLSKQLSAPIASHTLSIPLHRGSGEIKGILLEEGLFLRYARVSFNSATELVRLARQPEAEHLFSLCYLLTPGSIRATAPLARSEGTAAATGNTFLASNNTRVSVQFTPEVLSHSVELLFSREWLYAQLPGMEEKLKHLEDFLEQGNGDDILTGKTLPADEHLIGEIITELRKPDVNSLAVRSRLLLLFADTLSRWPGQTDLRPAIPDSWNVQTIRLVEHRLVHSLKDMLPSQKQLAREFAMSESTLKRHFKAVYGKTMYDYYLEKKMELAKWLLQEKNSSVSQTAYMLGYEKVSAFINMFKKYHHALPGSFLRREPRHSVRKAQAGH